MYEFVDKMGWKLSERGQSKLFVSEKAASGKVLGLQVSRMLIASYGL